ncbi:MAG: sodium:calcium antiporter, partial [Proteobacteria bacterium]|nr:sodium:calcium antiporter [Pseudomonadota bacterium]
IDIMIGNVVGSNIANVGLVLACSAILAPLAVHIKVLKTELYLLLSISLIVAVICWFGTFYRILGIMFIAGLILYTYLAYHDVRNHRVKEEELQGKKFSYWILLCLIVGGLVLLALGADFFIDGAVDMARYFGVSELVIGLTLAAVGTSLPELASCISAARRKESDMIVGNVIGSNLFNLMMVFGTTAAVMPFHLERQLLCRDLPVMIAFSAVLVPCLVLWQGVRRWHGVLLLCCYLGYLYTLL